MSKTTILIVEDEAIVAADLAGKLGQLGYEVAGTSAAGEEAVELACRLLPRVVLAPLVEQLLAQVRLLKASGPKCFQG